MSEFFHVSEHIKLIVFKVRVDLWVSNCNLIEHQTELDNFQC